MEFLRGHGKFRDVSRPDLINCSSGQPFDLDQFLEVVESIENSWFAVIKLPRCFEG